MPAVTESLAVSASPLRRLWLDASRGESAGVAGTALVCALTPLEWLYRAGLAAYLGLERIGLRRRTRIGARVVSVGNLTMGGTGKTSVVEALIRAIKPDIQTAVLLRGYGGEKSRTAQVVSSGGGPLLDWKLCGDEAALLAAALPGTAVLAGCDRRVTGEMAVREIGARLIVLDDGLQYWQLHRDLDIVLLDARSPFGNGHVMPAGPLREPASGLRRAGAVILTHVNESSADSLQRLRREVARLAPAAEVFEAYYAPSEIYRPTPDGGVPDQRQPAETLRGRRVLVFCGIGTPESFSATLEDAGAQIAGEMFLPDHHPFTRQDVHRAAEAAGQCGAELIVTTEKDAVRLAGLPLPDSMRVLRADLLITDLPGLARIASGGAE